MNSYILMYVCMYSCMYACMYISCMYNYECLWVLMQRGVSRTVCVCICVRGKREREREREREMGGSYSGCHGNAALPHRQDMNEEAERVEAIPRHP